MEHDKDLTRLEEFVERLVESHNQLKSENIAITNELLAKQQEINELREEIHNLQENRNVMHTRVIGIIDRIDEWEKVIEQNESGQNRDSAGKRKKNVTKKSSPLFKVSTEQSSGPAVS